MWLGTSKADLSSFLRRPQPAFVTYAHQVGNPNSPA